MFLSLFHGSGFGFRWCQSLVISWFPAVLSGLLFIIMILTFKKQWDRAVPSHVTVVSSALC